ncbi:hypothetical protein IAU59_004519 [Kwoniella sp. CBS 9459]
MFESTGRGSGRGRGRGRGAAPVKPEDRDVQGYANKRVANQGPPALLTNAATRGQSRGRGRGRGASRGRGDGSFGYRGRGGRGGGGAGGGGPSVPFGHDEVSDQGYPPRGLAIPRTGKGTSIRLGLGNGNGNGNGNVAGPSNLSKPKDPSASTGGGSWRPRYDIPAGPRGRPSDRDQHRDGVDTGAGASRERGISISSSVSTSGSPGPSSSANSARARYSERDTYTGRRRAEEGGRARDGGRPGYGNERSGRHESSEWDWDGSSLSRERPLDTYRPTSSSLVPRLTPPPLHHIQRDKGKSRADAGQFDPSLTDPALFASTEFQNPTISSSRGQSSKSVPPATQLDSPAVPPVRTDYRPPTIPKLSDLPLPTIGKLGPSRMTEPVDMASTSAVTLQTSRPPIVPPSAPIEVKKLIFKPKNPNKVAAQAQTASSSLQIPAAQPRLPDQTQVQAQPKVHIPPTPSLQTPAVQRIPALSGARSTGAGEDGAQQKTAEEVRVKAEPGVGPIPTYDFVHTAMMTIQRQPSPVSPAAVDEVDVKPTIIELEDEVQIIEVPEAQRPSGTLAINKREIPSECFSRDPVTKKKARVTLRKLKAEELVRMGRKIGRAHWRDDGVAYDWTFKAKPSQAKPSTSTNREKTPVTIERRSSSPASPVANFDQQAESSRRPSEGASEHLIATNALPFPKEAPTTEIAQTSNHAEATDDAQQPMAIDQLLTIPVEVTPNVRKESAAPLAIADTPSTRDTTAPTTDPESPVVSTSSTSITNANGIAIISGPSSNTPDDPSTWTDGSFTYRDLFAYPSGFARWTQEEQDVWVNRVWRIMSDPHGSGIASRWVRTKRQQNALAVLSKHKTSASVEQGGESNLVSVDEALKDVWSDLKRIATPHQARPNAPPPQNFISAISTIPAQSRAQAQDHDQDQSQATTTVPDPVTPNLTKTKKDKKSKKRDRSQLEVEVEDPTASTSGATDERAMPAKSKEKGKGTKKSKKIKKGEEQSRSPVKANTNDMVDNAVAAAKVPDPVAPPAPPLPAAGGSSHTTSSRTVSPHDFDPRLSSSSFAAPVQSTPATFTANLAECAPKSESKPETSAKKSPESKSPVLTNLNAELRQKVSEIERWTKLLCEYPDMANALSGQIERTQNEIFGLHDSISKERERLGL